DFEICDGVDNDRNGVVDDNPKECTPCLSVGACATNVRSECTQGAWTCAYESSAYEKTETRCDRIDNDCDGLTDELPECVEACNGADDDKDGNIDESPLGAPTCGGIGVCTAGGRPECHGASGWSCAYDGVGYEPNESRCDDLDNDCDGQVDESCSGNDRVVGISRHPFRTSLPMSIAFDLTLSGGRAYVNGSSNMQIVDITSPTSPVLRGTYTPPLTVQAIAAVGTNAYVATRGTSFDSPYLRTINASSPSTPTETAALPLSGSPASLTSSATHLF